ncbi:MAG: hypothetical protein M1820_004593 [Bogoriella megaspora]|nr:MAG: hypothetical protein M1820_004593 [Bogoriella megaspora]
MAPGQDSQVASASFSTYGSDGWQTVTSFSTFPKCTSSDGCAISNIATYTLESGVNDFEQPLFLMPTPQCELPSYVPACQSQWDFYMSGLRSLHSWATASLLPTCPLDDPPACVQSQLSWQSASDSITAKPGTEPFCTQASLATSICNVLRDEYITSWLGSNQGAWYTDRESAGYIDSYTTFPNGSSAQTEFWPTSSSLGPECPLGCGRCAITGGTVQLFYWPATRTVNGTNGTGPVVASASGTFLTSPTVYISFASIYASDSCSGVGPKFGSTIIPVANPSAISSVWNDWPDFQNPRTAVFNYTDLNSPIPESIYVRQPQCAADSS